MKKKVILGCIIALIISLLGYFSFSIISKIEHNNRIHNQLVKMPNFQFTTLSDDVFTNTDLPTNKNILWVFFSPDCHFCIIEANEFAKKAKDFKDTQINFVSSAEKMEIIQFIKKQKLANISNIQFLYDTKGVIIEKFNASSIPYMILYNKKKEWKKEYRGAIKIDLIIKDLQTQ